MGSTQLTTHLHIRHCWSKCSVQAQWQLWRIRPPYSLHLFPPYFISFSDKKCSEWMIHKRQGHYKSSNSIERGIRKLFPGALLQASWMLAKAFHCAWTLLWYKDTYFRVINQCQKRCEATLNIRKSLYQIAIVVLIIEYQCPSACLPLLLVKSIRH